MERELGKITELLQVALQMEIEGKRFYQRASEESSNRLVKELFWQLAREEDIHGKKFQEIYEALVKEQHWPVVDLPTDKGKTLKHLLGKAIKTWGTKVEAVESEVEAIKIALDMESKSYNFYLSRSEESVSTLERRFYELLAGEEQGHRLVLSDSYEYLTNPTGWFAKKEHWSLDGI